MRGYLTDSAQELRSALAELAGLRAQLTRIGQTAPDRADDTDYVTRFRDFKYYETLFELFAKQYEIARVDEAREGPLLQVMDTARAPQRKSKPQKALIAVIAALATGFAILLFVFVRQALRNAAQDEETAGKLRAIRRAVGVRS
jgi:uncharacterized protein involved in exopolysaccharide biosynthesis